MGVIFLFSQMTYSIGSKHHWGLTEVDNSPDTTKLHPYSLRFCDSLTFIIVYAFGY